MRADLGGDSVTRVLITGAAGFLGRWFANYHARQGHYVYGVDNLSNPHSQWPDLIPEHRRFPGDAGDFFSAERMQWDLAYHFAAPVGGRTKIEGDPLFNADSLRLDALFFRWAVNHVGIAVYPSSSAIYPVFLQQGPGMLLTEDLVHPKYPEWGAPDEMYGFTKLAGEILAWKAEQYGLNTLCIRPFSGYGEGQSMEYPVPSICARAKRHDMPLEVWGSGQQQRDFVHVEDLVRATVARLDVGVRGYQTMNICSGVGVSFSEVASLAASITGYDPAIKTDETKPQGVDSRRGNPDRMSQFYTPQISLRDGLARVIDSLS